MGEASAEGYATDAYGRKLIWTYGANDSIEELPAEKLKDFKATGSFRSDFASLSGKCGIAVHPGFVPPPPAKASSAKSKESRPNKSPVPDEPVPEKQESSVIAVQATLIGRGPMLVLRHVITTSLHIEVLRLTSCCIDFDAIMLLRASLTEACSVAVLQLDWNPLEVPVDSPAVKLALEAGSRQDIDALEQTRERQQADRTLRAFGELMAARCGDVARAMKAIQIEAVKDKPQYEETAGVEPFPLSKWMDAFHVVLNVGAAETDQIFSIIDGPFYGTGDGLASFHALESTIQGLPPLEAEDEANDPVGKAFGAFVDATSPLDVVSFRHCSIGRLDCVAISKAMSQSYHLRGLNLYGNKICDGACAVLAESFEIYQGLEFLGLGRNLVTHVGLERLCEPLGFTRIDDKAEAENVQKDIAAKSKEKPKAVPAAKKDRHGVERYMPKPQLPTCEQKADESGDFWLWGRNLILQTLVLEHNPITDAAAVMKLQPMGVGEIQLRGIPCADELNTLIDAAAAATSGAGDADSPVADDAPPPAAGAKDFPLPGWKLRFK